MFDSFLLSKQTPPQRVFAHYKRQSLMHAHFEIQTHLTLLDSVAGLNKDAAA